MLENKEVMAANLKKYMDRKGVNAAEVCSALGFKPNTFSNWINAKIYPRIDKIQLLAEYFGISKAALVEGADNMTLSSKEQSLILNYREADETTRSIVDKILLEKTEAL